MLGGPQGRSCRLSGVKDWLCTYRYTDEDNVQMANTFCVHAQPVLPLTPDPSASQAADDISAWLTTKFRDCLRTIFTLEDLTVRELFTSTPAEATKAINAAGTLGTLSGFLPRQVCLLMTLRTAVATRSGRGRIFLPSPKQSSFLSDPDEWSTSAGLWLAAVALGDQFLAGSTVAHSGLDTHYSLRIYSRSKSATYDVTSYLLRKQPHWLRSRSK